MKNHNRPYIICHMMQTIDGKIASGLPDKDILMDFFDQYTRIEHEFDATAWMFGRKTAEGFAEDTNSPLPASNKESIDQDFIAPFSDTTFAIAIDTHGILRWKNNYINLTNQTNNFHLIIIVTKQTPREYLSYLKGKNISYIIGGESEVNFGETLEKLKENFGVQKILLEGGASFNGSLMSTGMVDEISLLLIPRVLNKKDAPSLFDFDTDAVQPKDYTLVAIKQLDESALWLRYKR